jgi:hypothetical protein
LYLSNTGYGKISAWQIISGFLQYHWMGLPVSIYIGGSTDNVAIDSGQMYFDNFEVNSGLLSDWPPPNDINHDGFIDMLDIDMLFEQWLMPGENQADINRDNIVNFRDFAELAPAW